MFPPGPCYRYTQGNMKIRTKFPSQQSRPRWDFLVRSTRIATATRVSIIGLALESLFLPADVARAQGAPAFTNLTNKGIAAGLNWTGGTGPFLLQKKVGLSDSNWVNVLTTSNRTIILAKEAQSAFLRLQNQTTNTVLPFTVFMNAASEVPPVNNSSG